MTTSSDAMAADDDDDGVGAPFDPEMEPIEPHKANSEPEWRGGAQPARSVIAEAPTAGEEVAPVLQFAFGRMRRNLIGAQDPWAQLDPHAAPPAGTLRPLRKRITYRLPASLSGKADPAPKASTVSA